MSKIEDIKQMLSDLRELSYETGYIAGKIEAGEFQDDAMKKYQRMRVDQRNTCYEHIHLLLEEMKIER